MLPKQKNIRKNRRPARYRKGAFSQNLISPDTCEFLTDMAGIPYLPAHQVHSILPAPYRHS